MTKTKYRVKPVWHETGVVYDGRKIVVAESPVNLLLRLKGTRQVLELSWNAAYLRAAMIQTAVARMDKINRRKTSRRPVGRGNF